ncbi:zinc finger BED domain-containing protein 6-like [Microplitis demolitor]|uniref:zinc finger BED domain-containing protein 6-like n=1 Tax=Microplitis demolitor TaxID=69319 RepID=UPI00235B645E|nr:zinc finger BED domain-containing protein 6-like [Microplitis demolitor]
MAPRKKTSVLRDHFSECQPKLAKSQYCTQKIAFTAGSFGNLSRHLIRKHPTISINVADRQSTVSSTVDIETLTTSDQNLPLVTFKSKSVSQDNTQLTINTFTESMKPIVPSKKKKKQIDQQLITMIAKEYHPLYLVEETEFKNFVHLLCPSYSLPSRKALSENLLPQLYLKLTHEIQSKIEKALAICLTTDGWTSRNNQSFIAVTAHYIDVESMHLCSNLLGCIEYDESHTAENLCNFLKEEMSKWNIENKVGAVVSDHAANIISAVQLGGWRFIGCFAHLLNLIVQTAVTFWEITQN